MKRKKVKISKAIRNQYETYSRNFTIEKKRGNIVRGQRKATLKQFASGYKVETTKDRITFGKRLLRAQKKFKNEKQEMAMYKKYMAKTKQLKRGQTLQIEATRTEGLGNVGTEVITLKKREKLSSFVKNTGLRDLISLRIFEGEDREEVLDDYGY